MKTAEEYWLFAFGWSSNLAKIEHRPHDKELIRKTSRAKMGE